MEDVNSELFDVRVVEHNIRRGVITREQYSAWLKSLPDHAEDSLETETMFSTPYANRVQNAEQDSED